MLIDLNKYSFEQWVSFIFDHPIAQAEDKAWYWPGECEYEAYNYLMLEYLIRLFRNPTFLLDAYSTEQLEQGFWFVLKPSGFLKDKRILKSGESITIDAEMSELEVGSHFRRTIYASYNENDEPCEIRGEEFVLQ